MAKPQQATQPVSQFTPPDVEASQVAASGFAVSEVGYSMQLPRPTVMKLRHAVPERFAVCSQPIGGLVLWQRGVPPAIILARPSDIRSRRSSISASLTSRKDYHFLSCACAVQLRSPARTVNRLLCRAATEALSNSFMRLLSFRGSGIVSTLGSPQCEICKCETEFAE